MDDPIRRFGLIGHPVGHSWSQRHFEEKWQREGITDCVYELHDLAQVEKVSALWAESGWKGMNVTVPHKQAILPLLDGISATAHAIGAVNTIAFTEAGRIGHNTDAHGFRRAIAPYLKGHHHRALILGTGGSALAVRHVLRDIGLEVTCASRNPGAQGTVGYDALSAVGIQHTPVIVNCTPVGMHPNTADLPPLGGAIEGVGPDHLVMDLIYNPRETALLKRASSLGARTLDGSSMLIHQAEAAWDIWCGEETTT